MEDMIACFGNGLACKQGVSILFYVYKFVSCVNFKVRGEHTSAKHCLQRSRPQFMHIQLAENIDVEHMSGKSQFDTLSRYSFAETDHT